MRPNSLILYFWLIAHTAFGQSSPKFSKEAVLADLSTLRVSLEEAHYDVYTYTSPSSFETRYEAVKMSIVKDSLDLLEATNCFQKLITVVNNGHTEIPFPGQSYIQYAYAGGTLFPLEIAFEDDKSFIRKNWSREESIAIGSEILSVNGQSIPDILRQMYPHISAERPYFKHVKIELYSFPRLYWQVFGPQDAFEVEIREQGETKRYKLEAINLIEDFEKKRRDVLDAQMCLKFYEKAAYLNPGNFSGDEPVYQAFIDSAFAQIKAQGSPNLIIDLRNNQGGDNTFSDYLVSYIADKPFRWNSQFTLKTSKFLKKHVRANYDTTSAFWQKALSQADGAVYAYEFPSYAPQAPEKRYQGKVYVLVNRQSHSMAAVTAAQIQDYRFATIVGEETGDYPTLLASQFEYTLPKTGVLVKVSKGYIVRVNGSTQAEGLMPDIYIQDHLLDDKDEILEGLLKKIP